MLNYVYVHLGKLLYCKDISLSITHHQGLNNLKKLISFYRIDPGLNEETFLVRSGQRFNVVKKFLFLFTFFKR